MYVYRSAAPRATTTTRADTSQAGTARWRRASSDGMARGSGGPSTASDGPSDGSDGPSDGSDGPSDGSGGAGDGSGGPKTAAGTGPPSAATGVSSSGPGSGSEISRHSPDPMAGAARVNGVTREATALAARNTTIR